MTGFTTAAFDWMFRATWQASCLAVLVLLVQWACGRRLSARARCWLWVVVIGRLMLPPLPAVRWTLLHARAAAPQAAAVVPQIAPAVQPPLALPQRLPLASPGLGVAPAAKPAVSNAIDPRLVAELRSQLARMREADVRVPVPAPVARTPATRPPAVAPAPAATRKIVNHQPWWPRIHRLAAWVWIVGVVVFFGRVVVSSVRLALATRRLPVLDAPGPNALLADCARQMGVRRVPQLRLADGLPGPALAGWLRPKLLVPRSVLGAFGDGELRLMFLHELAHVRRRDVPVNWLLSAVTSLHWFNPVVWLSARRLRADRELACDERVLATHREPGAAPQYGQTLLRLADWLARGPTPVRRVAGVVEILEDARELQRRIVMIARFNPALKRWPALAAGGVLLLAALALTDAAEPAVATTRPLQKNGRAAATTQPRISAPVEQTEMARLLQVKVDALRAQLKARQEGYELAKKQFDAGVPAGSQDSIARAAAEVAEVKMALTDAQIALARSQGGAADVPKLLARKVTEAEEVLDSRKRSTALNEQRYKAALCDYTAVTEAQSLQAKAEAALADAKLALDAVDHRAAGGAQPPAAAETADSLEIKLNQAKVQLRIKDTDLGRLQAMNKVGNADAVDVARAEQEVAYYRWAATDAATKLALLRSSADAPKLLDRRVEEAADFINVSDHVAQLMKKKYEAGACELAKVKDAEAWAAQARAMLADAKAAVEAARHQPPQAAPGTGEAEAPARSGSADAAPDRGRVMDLKVTAAKAKLAHAEAELARAQELAKQGAISQSELEQLKAAAAQARADLAEAELQAQASRSAGPGPSPAVQASSPADLTAAVQDPDAQRIDEEAARKLLKPITFTSAGKPRPIGEWSQDLAKEVGVNVIVETRALEAAGIADDTPIKLSLHEPAPAAQVLTWALRDMGGGTVHVGYTIDHGAVVISTAEELARLAVTRVYDVSDLVTPTGPGSDLPALLINVIDPPSWRDNGGTVGVVLQFRDKLVVTQNQQNHADVARLLTLLRAKAAANPGAMGPAPAFGTTQPAQADNVSRLLDQYGPNHPAVVAARREQARAVDQLKEQSAEHMRQLLVAVKIYDRVHKVLPPRLGQAELQNLLTMRVEENPRLPFLSAGYEWVGPEDPRFPRLADIKDPAHTPLIRETAPQPDGSLLVGYADGHVAEVTAEQLKADAH